MSSTGLRYVPSPRVRTHRHTDPDECRASVRMALETGYCHIDTAEAYGNEAMVAAGIEAAAVLRDEVFLATKVLYPMFTGSYAATDLEESGRAYIERLGVDSVDLFYGIHWPDGEPPAYDADEVARACETLADEGAFDRFGVCNLTPALIDAFDDATTLDIDVLQVEMHPLLKQESLRAYCDTNGIDLVAYGPLGNGMILDVPELQAIAEKHHVSVAQVSLAWLRAQGVATIPKATGEAHISDNWASLNLELDDKDLVAIDAIDREERVYDPDYAPNW